MEEKETCPTALMLKLQAAEYFRTAEEVFRLQMAEFERVFGKIPGQSKEGK